MKKIAIAIMLSSVICACIGCKKEQPSVEATDVIGGRNNVIVTKVARCPNGHTAIKDVPIVYGLIQMTPERREKEKNYEVDYGGCLMDSHGKYKFACTTCGCFTYEKVGPRYTGEPIWFDKETKVIPAGDAITITKTVD